MDKLFRIKGLDLRAIVKIFMKCKNKIFCLFGLLVLVRTGRLSLRVLLEIYHWTSGRVNSSFPSLCTKLQDGEVVPERVCPFGAQSEVTALSALDSVPLVLPNPTRVRPRAVWVRRLQDRLGGRVGVVRELLQGRWIPDLPGQHASGIANAFVETVAGGARIIGGGSIRVGKEAKPLDYLCSEHRNGEVRWVIPELVGTLSTYSWGKPRDREMLLALQSRGRDWLKARDFPGHLRPHFLHGSVLSAFETGPLDEVCEQTLRDSGYSSSSCFQ